MAMVYDLVLIGLLVAAAAHFMSIAVVLLRTFQRTTSSPALRPPITILRPVCGIENYLEETLASGFAIEYPEFEIVFCVAGERDPVIPIIRRLIELHPDVPSRLLIGDHPISVNPKLNNLMKGWRAAKYDWIVMADSNVLIPPTYLDELLACWTDRVGLVCSPPVGTCPIGIGAELEATFLNTYQARWQLVADALGIGFAQGKTMLWRRAELDLVGGIAALASDPAEDAAATKFVRASGKRVRLVRQLFPQPLGFRSIGETWQRQLRWARLRRATFPVFYGLEILSGGFPALVLATVVVALNPQNWAIFFALFVCWYGTEVIFAHKMGWPVSLRTGALLLIRDLALPALWLAGWAGDTYVWRGNSIDIGSSQSARLLFPAEIAFSRPQRRSGILRSIQMIRAFRPWPRPSQSPRTASACQEHGEKTAMTLDVRPTE